MFFEINEIMNDTILGLSIEEVDTIINMASDEQAEIVVNN